MKINKKGFSEVASIIVMTILIVVIVVIVLVINFSLEPHFKIYKNESGELVEVDNLFNLLKQNLTQIWLYENCEDITLGMSIETFRCGNYTVEFWNQIK